MNIKKYPWILSWVPNRGFTLYPYIFLRKDVYEDWQSKSPLPKTLGTLIHEQTHLSRIEKRGILSFAILYLFNPDFRLNEEIEAIKPQVKYLKTRRENVDIEKWAKALSGWQYLWCTSYKKAKKVLSSFA